MKTYTIKTNHEVEIDNFEEGLTKFVNSYNLSKEVKAETPREAIQKYFDTFLYYTFNFQNAYILHEEEENEAKNILIFDILVDEENNEAFESQIEQWQRGEIILYNNRITLEIFLNELVQI